MKYIFKSIATLCFWYAMGFAAYNVANSPAATLGVLYIVAAVDITITIWAD